MQHNFVFVFCVLCSMALEMPHHHLPVAKQHGKGSLGTKPMFMPACNLAVCRRDLALIPLPARCISCVTCTGAQSKPRSLPQSIPGTTG